MASATSGPKATKTVAATALSKDELSVNIGRELICRLLRQLRIFTARRDVHNGIKLASDVFERFGFVKGLAAPILVLSEFYTTTLPPKSCFPLYCARNELSSLWATSAAVPSFAPHMSVQAGSSPLYGQSSEAPWTWRKNRASATSRPNAMKTVVATALSNDELGVNIGWGLIA
eukprot:CAMPEP_0117576434 /NCGR_PEP_ID=MMETSP0784-20121206/62795_1 /TAXON_ID=39447 /ORGANISM="" /LENGTH=173 /DNA_ID=CAMNT_0005375685 /DNA_START=309 /DNA_END=831 /DNA_ORIENTATION=-